MWWLVGANVTCTRSLRAGWRARWQPTNWQCDSYFMLRWEESFITSNMKQAHTHSHIHTYIHTYILRSFIHDEHMYIVPQLMINKADKKKDEVKFVNISPTRTEANKHKHIWTLRIYTCRHVDDVDDSYIGHRIQSNMNRESSGRTSTTNGRWCNKQQQHRKNVLWSNTHFCYCWRLNELNSQMYVLRIALSLSAIGILGNTL